MILNHFDPSIAVETQLLECTDNFGKTNHVLLMHVFASAQLHANQADDVYYRIDDIDLPFVELYIDKIGYGKSAIDYLKSNKDFIVYRNGKEEISAAAILLFGKNPQHFFQRARIRFIRYDGTEARVGAEMNVIKDVVFEGKILDMAEQTISFVRSQIREHTFLGANGRFITIPELPEFCWTELIVNSIAHRDYSIAGTDIQIKMFDDHFKVESPGTLPGLVRTSNIREIHFSRNPKIVQFLHEYEYVKEYGEGADRMYREMEIAKLPEPEYRTVEFMVYATIKNHKWMENQVTPQVTKASVQDLLEYCSVPRSKQEMMSYLGLSDPKNFRSKYLRPLLLSEQIQMTIPDKPNSKLQKYIKV